MTVNEGAHLHSGNVLVNAMITTRSRLYQLVDKEKWRCLNCNELIERKNRNILEPPRKPSECPSYDTKDFEEKHDLKY